MKFLLVGKPNVGKSSIYNILCGSNLNIIHKDSGTTRDWHEERFEYMPNNIIIDAPGILFSRGVILVKITFDEALFVIPDAYSIIL